MLLLGDPRIRNASVENLNLILQHTYWWPNGEADIYRPLTTLSYLFNYSILGNGNHPAGYHWVNFFPFRQRSSGVRPGPAFAGRARPRFSVGPLYRDSLGRASGANRIGDPAVPISSPPAQS